MTDTNGPGNMGFLQAEHMTQLTRMSRTPPTARARASEADHVMRLARVSRTPPTTAKARASAELTSKPAWASASVEWAAVEDAKAAMAVEEARAAREAWEAEEARPEEEVRKEANTMLERMAVAEESSAKLRAATQAKVDAEAEARASACSSAAAEVALRAAEAAQASAEEKARKETTARELAEVRAAAVAMEAEASHEARLAAEAEAEASHEARLAAEAKALREEQARLTAEEARAAAVAQIEMVKAAEARATDSTAELAKARQADAEHGTMRKPVALVTVSGALVTVMAAAEEVAMEDITAAATSTRAPTPPPRKKKGAPTVSQAGAAVEAVAEAVHEAVTEEAVVEGTTRTSFLPVPDDYSATIHLGHKDANVMPSRLEHVGPTAPCAAEVLEAPPLRTQHAVQQWYPQWLDAMAPWAAAVHPGGAMLHSCVGNQSTSFRSASESPAIARVAASTATVTGAPTAATDGVGNTGTVLQKQRPT